MEPVEKTAILSALDEHEPEAMGELTAYDLAKFFGNGGALAQHLPGYELRPSQLQMAEAIKHAILAKQHALIEAPTGTGKSIAYLVPALLSGKTVVVATANKSLQSQLFHKDIPFLRKVLQRPIRAVVVKGRSNFVCNLKWEKELATQQQFALYDREHQQVTFLRTWLEKTTTGDVDDLPFVLESDLRPRVVSYPDDCLHQDCRLYDEHCWVNHMRDAAAEAQILITNHHLLLNALELGWAGERILPPAAIYVIDEAHGLEQTATAVFETTVTDYTVEQLLTRSVLREQVDEAESDEIRFQNTLAFQEVAHLNRENAYRIESELEGMKKLGRKLSELGQRLKQRSPYANKSDDELLKETQNAEQVGEARKAYELTIETVNSTANKLLTVASSARDAEMVRYAVRVFDRRHTTLEIHAAPINPANFLSQFLFHPEEDSDTPPRTVICTSATLATNGHFQHFKQRCGLLEVGEEKVLPAVFDYPQQALLYQPPLPAYDYRNADGYYSAVAAEIERLLEVSRGRALCLFTSWSGLQQVSDRLRGTDGTIVWPLRAQGDAPRDALLTWFKNTPHSVLLATRSFWEGVDIPGEELSLVILDKMPFPTPGDPLHSARMAMIDTSGQSSFGDYMLPLMNLALKQGFGRLIRRASDRGVVAILDERLSSKGYGRQTRQDLPPARFSRDFKDVHKFFQQALTCDAEFALNVWSATSAAPAPVHKLADPAPTSSGPHQWHWQLLRLQDGKADHQTGVLAESANASPGLAELEAARHGLQDLRGRIERAGRQPGQYSIELRCRHLPETLAALPTADAALADQWTQLQNTWRAIHLRPLPPLENA
ncbi:MAG: ATP-dependent DNA helicase [Caldilineaceae bacterium]|nr:ATP-dependent DNA helicase [Caldilineaceae bacterium]